MSSPAVLVSERAGAGNCDKDSGGVDTIAGTVLSTGAVVWARFLHGKQMSPARNSKLVPHSTQVGHSCCGLAFRGDFEQGIHRSFWRNGKSREQPLQTVITCRGIEQSKT